MENENRVLNSKGIIEEPVKAIRNYIEGFPVSK